MHRALFIAGGGYLALCAAVVFQQRAPVPVPVTAPSPAPTPAPRPVNFGGSAQQWFAAIKPYCNQVETVLAIRQHPAPASLDGQGFGAACYALGGKIDSA